MFYAIYRITNKINQHYYIGSHITENLNDRYFGSGKLIKDAIKKYGIENFAKDILFLAFDEQSLDWAEEQLVTIQAIDQDSYNLIPGGRRPPKMFGKDNFFYKKRAPRCDNRKGTRQTEATKLKISQANLGNPPTIGMAGRHHSEESKHRSRQSNRLSSTSRGRTWIIDPITKRRVWVDKIMNS